MRGNMWAAAAAAAAEEEFGNVRELEVVGNFDECAVSPKWAKSNLDEDEKFEMVEALSSILDAEPLDVSQGLGSSVDIGLLGGEFLFGDNCEWDDPGGENADFSPLSRSTRLPNDPK